MKTLGTTGNTDLLLLKYLSCKTFQFTCNSLLHLESWNQFKVIEESFGNECCRCWTWAATRSVALAVAAGSGSKQDWRSSHRASKERSIPQRRPPKTEQKSEIRISSRWLSLIIYLSRVLLSLSPKIASWPRFLASDKDSRTKVVLARNLEKQGNSSIPESRTDSLPTFLTPSLPSIHLSHI